MFTWSLVFNLRTKENLTLSKGLLPAFGCKHRKLCSVFFPLEQQLGETDLVNEIEGHSSLTNTHLFRLEMGDVLAADVFHTCLQFASNLVFFPVLLSLY